MHVNVLDFIVLDFIVLDFILPPRGEFWM